MSGDDPLSWLAEKTSAGVRWGVERTEALLAGVGDPHRHFRALHIGGTNGKGSVAALCDSALRAAGGARVGLYTSPHLVRFAERIQVDGAPVDEALLMDSLAHLRPEIERSGATFFEAATALALLCFAEAGVEVAVVEVGLGGRLDATRVVTPIVTAVTQIARDHEEYLGSSLEVIAAEKAGIWRSGVPAITAETAPALLAVLRERAAEAGAPFIVLDGIAAVDTVEMGMEGTRFQLTSTAWGERRVWTPLVGAHQVRNAALAAEILALLPGDLLPEWEAVAAGFASVRWPGRFQVERVRGTTWIFDVAHNPAGAAALAATLKQVAPPRPRVLVAGILADKAWPEMLPPLLAEVDAVVLTVPPSAPAARRWQPEAVAAALASTSVPVRVIPDLGDALSRASTLAPHGTVLVTGSVHTVGDALAVTGFPAR